MLFHPHAELYPLDTHPSAVSAIIPPPLSVSLGPKVTKREAFVNQQQLSASPSVASGADSC